MTTGWAELGDDHVPGWALRDQSELPAAAQALAVAADELEQVGAGLRALLGDTVNVLGWRGAASQAASGAGAEAAGAVVTAAGALSQASDAVGALAAALAEQLPALRGLLQERLTAVVAVVEGDRPTDPRSGLPIGGGAGVGEIDARILPVVAALAQADDTAAHVLRVALDALEPLTRADGQAAWVTTAAPAGAVGVLQGAGLVDDPAELTVLGQVAGLPAGPAGVARLRQLLCGLAPADATALVERHPELARRLVGGPPAAADLTPASPEAALAAALAAAGPLAPRDRVSSIRAFFAALPPGAALRLAVLYPAVVGTLDGAPLPARVAANRVAIAAELQAQRERLARLVVGDEEQSEVSHWRQALAESAVTGYVAHVDSPAADVRACESRIAYAERLLAEELPNPARGDVSWGRPAWKQHQVLSFDPAGDGAIAELWGDLDEHTRHVAVFVPGTSAQLAGGSFEGYSAKMRELAREDGTGATATIAWLGSDMPDAIVADATRPSYALAAGPRLRDFVGGVGVPPTADSTVIGHSYGGAVVGAADQAGLEATRVLHVESAGAGRTVWSVAGYHEAETGRHIDHYTMTAPGDPIALARQGGLVQEFGIGHGGDPDAMPGFVRLETGRFDDVGDPARRGTRIAGFAAHTAVLTPGSTAWNNLAAVVGGRPAVPYVPPQPAQGDAVPMTPLVPTGLVDPYADPSFTSPATLPIA